MNMLLKDYKIEFREKMLTFLWRQWVSLGVIGNAVPWKGSVIDPEALLLVSCTVGRYDPRLFDAVLDWLTINGRYLNIQRMKRMLSAESFSGKMVLKAIAATVKTSVNGKKWAQLAEISQKRGMVNEPLFFLRDGRDLPVVKKEDAIFSAYGFSRECFQENHDRNVAQQFRPEPDCNLLLKLRAFLGVNARCELLTYLLMQGQGSPRAVARSCGYSPPAVTKTLAEMQDSGYLVSRELGRRRLYTLIPETWSNLLLVDEPGPKWYSWGPLFSALEKIWLFLLRSDLFELSLLAQSSDLRRLLRKAIIPKLNQSGCKFIFGDDTAFPGEELIPIFVDRIRNLLNRLGQ